MMRPAGMPKELCDQWQCQKIYANGGNVKRSMRPVVMAKNL